MLIVIKITIAAIIPALIMAVTHTTTSILIRLILILIRIPTLIPLILTDLLTIAIAILTAKRGATFPDTITIIAATNITSQDIGNATIINPKRRLNASFFLTLLQPLFYCLRPS